MDGKAAKVVCRRMFAACGSAGNNRAVCFYCDADYAFYLQKLKEVAEKYRVSIHAFVLMTNRVHLLVTPADEDSVSRIMQSLGLDHNLYGSSN